MGTVPAANRTTTMTLNATHAIDSTSPSQGNPPDTGFELGWDYAHYAGVPPTEHLHPLSPVRQGWEAGRECFGRRTLLAHRFAADVQPQIRLPPILVRPVAQEAIVRQDRTNVAVELQLLVGSQRCDQPTGKKEQDGHGWG